MARRNPALKPGEKIAPAVKEGVLHALATAPLNEQGKARPGTYNRISEQWGVSIAAIDKMKTRNAEDIQALRLQAADRNLILASRFQDAALADFDDPEKLAKTSMKDKAVSIKALTDSAVTLVEGHTTTAVQVNFRELKAARASLEAFDARKKAITVGAQ